MEFDSVKHPVKHNTPVPPESRDALESLTFGAEAMDEAEHITAMTELFGHTATFWFCLGSAVMHLWGAGNNGNASADYAKARFYFKKTLSLPNARIPNELRIRVQFAEKMIPKE